MLNKNSPSETPSSPQHTCILLSLQGKGNSEWLLVTLWYLGRIQNTQHLDGTAKFRTTLCSVLFAKQIGSKTLFPMWAAVYIDKVKGDEAVLSQAYSWGTPIHRDYSSLPKVTHRKSVAELGNETRASQARANTPGTGQYLKWNVNPHLYKLQKASRPAQKLQEWHHLCISYTDTVNETCLFVNITLSLLKEHEVGMLSALCDSLPRAVYS